MGRRGVYSGVADPEGRFETLRPAVDRLLVLYRDHSRLTPAGAALDHAIIAIRMAANLLTHSAEFCGATAPRVDEEHMRTVAELDSLRSALDVFRDMAASYRPSSPEAQSLEHAVLALPMAADVLTGRSDFFRITSGDGSSPAMR